MTLNLVKVWLYPIFNKQKEKYHSPVNKNINMTGVSSNKPFKFLQSYVGFYSYISPL